jgi:hypothetical protein
MSNVSGKDRYFAIVIRVPAKEAYNQLGGILDASTSLWHRMCETGPSFLPAGSRITRSIEITEEVAINGLR